MAIKRKSPSETSKRSRARKRTKQLVPDAAPWSDLPDDILELVTDKMNILDFTRFRLACKTWKSFHKSGPLRDHHHPWLLSFDDNGYRLYQPSSRLKIPKSKSDFSLNPFHVCASKKGWLLLRHRASPEKVVAYSPFMTKSITLPLMNFKLASFSTTPSDPDCVFFGLNDEPLEGTTIGLWRQDERNWRILEFTGFHDMKNSIFSKGSFYCSNQRGLLGVFSVHDQSWRIIEEIKPIYYGFPSPYESHLVESKDRIFLVLLKMMRPCCSAVFEVDFSKKEWVRKQSMEKMAVFVDGAVAMMTAAASSVNVRKSRERVYYIEGAECRFCCLTGKFRRSYKFVKPYKLGPDEDRCKKLWVEPPPH